MPGEREGKLWFDYLVRHGEIVKRFTVQLLADLARRWHFGQHVSKSKHD